MRRRCTDRYLHPERALQEAVGTETPIPFPPARDLASCARADTGWMSMSFEPHCPRVPALLLVHCSEFEARHPSAYARLVAELGDNLAQMLVFALAGPHSRLGSSSP